MPNRPTALTSAAGEHYVAYRLSALGFPVALTRGGSPTVDLMVGDLSGHSAISIQVKTSNSAWRSYKRRPADNHWEWDIGRKGLELRGEAIFYALVDLRWDVSNPREPEVFIVPSADIANWMKPNFSRFMFWLMESDRQRYHECWDLITSKLQQPATAAGVVSVPA